ncbi:MAG: NAD(P)H-hydrate dehydratase [Actinobacteria bacterium]|nr:NAD(P)H-hydrate dehydratase [Actinomycetota bacterium]
MQLRQPDYGALFPYRDPEVHKGQCGRIGVLAGSDSMVGAAVLAANAALRTGAGLVTLMTCSPSHINVTYPELIVVPVPSYQDVNGEQALFQVRQYCEQYRIETLVMGCGLGRSEGVFALVNGLVSDPDLRSLPMVLDADALMVLDLALLLDRDPYSVVLTPHPKEMAHLLSGLETDLQVPDPVTEQLAALQLASQQTHQVMVLKGKGSLIANGSEYVETALGNPGMATAGMGDVLAGVIGTLFAQMGDAFDAALLGTYLHALSGDIAYDEKDVGLVASDLIERLPSAIQVLKEGGL